MEQIDLPDAGPAAEPPCRNAEEASAWLARQPLAQPVQMQVVLRQAIAAIDASDIPVADRLGALDRLRSAAIVAQAAVELRYTRKPLPLPSGDAELFLAARNLWRSLALAYLRTARQLPAAEAVMPLHRGVMALRAEQYAHFLAGYEVPDTLLPLLYGVLASAEAMGVQYTALADPDYRHISESHIAGHVAWAFLLQFIGPFGLSLAQLTVANRAFSRWRELAAFRMQPDDSPRGRDLPLMDLLGKIGVAQGGPRWLDIRPIARKIRNRIEALEAGETPESLKLGRELSATACIRLLRQLDEALRPLPPVDGRESGDVTLVFGVENIYALMAGELFDPASGGQPARTVDHQRLAVFGFDNLVVPVDAGKKVRVSGEPWQAHDGCVSRAQEAGVRLSSPCLVAREVESGQVRLGVLGGLRIALDGKLKASVQWYSQPVQASAALVEGEVGARARVPAFVIGTGQGPSLVLPAGAAIRPGSGLVLEGEPRTPVTVGQVLERGSDFVRYAATPRH